MNEAIYGPIIMGCVTALFGWVLFKGFRSGVMEWGYFGVSISGARSTEPDRFWTAAILNGVPCCLGLIGTIAMIVWPYGIGS
jgi:hypothetical protein